MRKRTWLALFVAVYLIAHLQTYGVGTGALNGGVYLTLWPTSHWCGYEFRGTPGFFCDAD